MSGTEQQQIHDPVRFWEESAFCKERKMADGQSWHRVTDGRSAKRKNRGVQKGILGEDAACRPS